MAFSNIKSCNGTSPIRENSNGIKQNIYYILIYIYLSVEIHSKRNKFVHYFN
jgi:hypothetical protein